MSLSNSSQTSLNRRNRIQVEQVKSVVKRCLTVNRNEVEQVESVVKRCLTVNRIEVEQTLENVDTRNWSLFGRTALIPDLSQH